MVCESQNFCGQFTSFGYCEKDEIIDGLKKKYGQLVKKTHQLAKEKDVLAQNNKKLEEKLQEYQDKHPQKDEMLIDETISTTIQRIMKFEESISEARDEILGLDDDWNGEGDSRFLKSTWNRVESTIRSIYERALKIKLDLDPPDVEPSNRGAIDVIWHTKDFRLVLRVPKDDDKPIIYYADDHKNTTSRGSIELDNVSKVLDACLNMFKKN